MDRPDTCPNCGVDADGIYCPNCGQKQTGGLPSISEITHEVLGALFSYDGKLWRTLKCLITAPGQLSVEYVSGRRASYLGPWQLFLLLQAITFTIHQTLFDPEANRTHNKSLAILALGCIFVVALWLSETKRKSAFIHSLLVGSHIWSFLMLVLCLEYAVAVPFGTLLIRIQWLTYDFPIGQLVTLVAIFAMQPYLLLSLKRVYHRSWLRTILQWIWLNGVAVLGMYELRTYL
jgi:Protein of unknown function (DUF3667)